MWPFKRKDPRNQFSDGANLDDVINTYFRLSIEGLRFIHTALSRAEDGDETAFAEWDKFLRNAHAFQISWQRLNESRRFFLELPREDPRKRAYTTLYSFGRRVGILPLVNKYAVLSRPPAVSEGRNVDGQPVPNLSMIRQFHDDAELCEEFLAFLVREKQDMDRRLKAYASAPSRSGAAVAK